MVVIDGARFFLIWVLVVLSGCQVEMSATAPGALACAPCDADLASFRTSVFNAILAETSAGGKNCVSCHSVNASNFGTGFRMYASSTAGSREEKINFCAAYLYGPAHPNHKLGYYAATDEHTQKAGSGTSYTASDIQPLADWVAGYSTKPCQ